MGDYRAQTGAIELMVHGCEECAWVQLKLNCAIRRIDFTPQRAVQLAEMLMQAAADADPSLPNPSNPS